MNDKAVAMLEHIGKPARYSALLMIAALVLATAYSFQDRGGEEASNELAPENLFEILEANGIISHDTDEFVVLAGYGRLG